MSRRLHVALAMLVLVACGNSGPPPGPSDRPWTAADFEKVAATDSCRAMPRFGTPAFERMTDPAVLDTIDPPDLPHDQRLAALMDYSESLRVIYKRYAMTCGDPPGALVLTAVELELTAREAPLLDELLASFSPQDPTYETRVNGLAKMKQGMAAMATGAALMIRGTHYKAPLPGVGHRLGAVIARVKPWLGTVLDGALGNLDVPADDDDDANRRALREELRAALHESR